MKSKVSIIIPCYNHGRYLEEAVNSCLAQTYDNIEIIVVNDGSTDEYTTTLLQNYHRPKTKVITTVNQGLAATRNTGIQHAAGEYILPLDADDKIAPAYIEKAVQIMQNDPSVGIVYCNGEFFGVKQGPWKLKDYNFPDILNGNCIFCSAVFRKSDWKKVGGYKTAMIYGWEDYEFWLSLIETGVGVYKIPETLFYYRQHSVSMSTKIADDLDKKKFLFNQLFRFHHKLFTDNRKYLSSNIRKRFDVFCGQKPPFFYEEKTSTHKFYHIGKFVIKIKRKTKRTV